MAEEKKTMNNEQENAEKENTKNTQDNQNNEPVQDPPANVPEDEKKGFHPIQGIKNWGHGFAEKHPKITAGAKTAGKVAIGVGIGAVGTVAVLAKVAASKGAESDENDDLGFDSYDDDDNTIDSTATEVDDSEQ